MSAKTRRGWLGRTNTPTLGLLSPSLAQKQGGSRAIFPRNLRVDAGRLRRRPGGVNAGENARDGVGGQGIRGRLHNIRPVAVGQTGWVRGGRPLETLR
eukprot:3053198-Lingulodinium_polyedra.AAC.1